MKGIKKVSGETKRLRGYYDSYYLQLFYDKATDEVWTTAHCDFGHGSYTVNIINCGDLCTPKTMKEIEEIVKESVRMHELYD